MPVKNPHKKQQEASVQIKCGATDGLDKNEKLVYYILTEQISWEDNFAKNADGSFMSITAFADAIPMSRPHVTHMLRRLQDKNRLRLVSTGKGKSSCIYLYSAWVWYGYAKHKSDDALDRFIEVIGAANREDKDNNAY